MPRRSSFAVYEVLFASLIASSTIYIFTLQMIARYWLAVAEPSFASTITCGFAFLIWIFLLLWIRSLPLRLFVHWLRRGSIHYVKFASWRKCFDHLAWTVFAWSIAAIGFLLMLRPVWDTRPLLLGLPVMWISGLRRLLALPEPTDQRNSLTVRGPAPPLVSKELSDADAAARQVEEDWHRR